MYILFALAILVVGGLAIAGILDHTRNRLDSNRKDAVESRRALGKAESALRSIANGAGNPALEAQIALDEITAYHEKELTQ